MSSFDFTLFYGLGCDACEEVRLQLAQLSFKQGFSYEEIEVWNNNENKKKFDKLVSKDKCENVPVLLNNKSGAIWCDKELKSLKEFLV